MCIRDSPITLDVGTNNKNLLKSPTYLGINKNRVEGSEYDYFIEKFMITIKKIFPSAVIQFEDFANKNGAHVGYWMEPKPGECILFPSHLEHWVEQNKSTEDRISISFNIGLR